MDWKLEQKKREKNQRVKNNEFSQGVNIVGEMDRGFTQIFGGSGSVSFSLCRGQAGDPVRRTESAGQAKKAKAE